MFGITKYCLILNLQTIHCGRDKEIKLLLANFNCYIKFNVVLYKKITFKSYYVWSSPMFKSYNLLKINVQARGCHCMLVRFQPQTN